MVFAAHGARSAGAPLDGPHATSRGRNGRRKTEGSFLETVKSRLDLVEFLLAEIHWFYVGQWRQPWYQSWEPCGDRESSFGTTAFSNKDGNNSEGYGKASFGDEDCEGSSKQHHGDEGYGKRSHSDNDSEGFGEASFGDLGDSHEDRDRAENVLAINCCGCWEELPFQSCCTAAHLCRWCSDVDKPSNAKLHPVVDEASQAEGTQNDEKQELDTTEITPRRFGEIIDQMAAGFMAKYSLSNSDLAHEVSKLKTVLLNSDLDKPAYSKQQVQAMMKSVAERLAAAIPESAARRVKLVEDMEKGIVTRLRLDICVKDCTIAADNGFHANWERSELRLLLDACRRHGVKVTSHLSEAIRMRKLSMAP